MISIASQPTGVITSANNDNYYVVSSSTPFSQSQYNDFKYIADVYYYNDANPSGVRLTRLKSFPDLNYNFGTFNLRNIANTLVSYDFSYTLANDTVQPFHTSSNGSATIQLQLGEEYSYGSTFSQSLNLATTNPIAYFNGALTYVDQCTFDYNSIVMAPGSSPREFMTDYPSLVYPAYTELRQWLYFYNYPTSGGVYYSIVTTYDGTGATIGSYSIPNPYNVYQGVEYFACGYNQLKTFGTTYTSSYSVLSGTPIMFNPAYPVSKYTIQFAASGSSFSSGSVFLINAGGNFIINSDGSDIVTGGFTSGSLTVSNQLEFDIQTNCGKYKATTYAVYWLNSLGGWDSWLFNKKNIEAATKVTSQFKKIPGKLLPNGVISNNTYDRANSNYYTQVTNTLNLNSDFLSDQQVIYLKNLFSSPAIYVEDQNGVLQAANVTDDSYTLSKKVNAKVYSLSLNLELSQPDYRQTL